MKRTSTSLPRQLLMLFAGMLIALAGWPALADPPVRAARISFVSGSASFSPAGSEEWLQARINRPIWIGDRLWSGDGRIEIQLGGASLRLGPGTSVQILNFDNQIAQFEVTQGSVALHVRVIDRAESIEIATPTFAFVAREEGDYRIDVERDHTAVSVRRGYADVYGQDASYRVDRRERFSFYSADLRDYDVGPLPRPDAFDRWARERAQREDRSVSARYVSPELVGYVDLDQYGDWRTDATFGAVWVPRVEANWAPYRYGHWSWVDPWGWTWIDDAPWGFAPSHYGRWTRLGPSWAWVPGPRTVAPVYAPALVAWVGGDNFSLSISSGRARGVGWFPLAPGEIWRPSYDVSREYFTRVNVTNTVVNNTTVVNVYNNRNDVRISNVDYRFRSAPAAVTAVPVETFVQSRPVQRSTAQFSANAAAQANVLVAAPAQPVVQSIVGPAQRSQARPPAESMRRQVVARTAPPAVPTIENRAAMVREGKPVDRAALDRAAPAAAKPAPPQTAQPGAPQPPRAQAGSAEPRQLGANVRVVDAEKAQPKPLPPAAPAENRAARPAGKADDAKAARDADKDDAKGAQPRRDQPPQTAEPARGDAAPSPRAQPGREVPPAPRAEPRAPDRAPPAPAVAPQPATPPGRGDQGQPPRGQESPAAKPPAPATAPVQRGAPAARPDADRPDVDQLRGKSPDRTGSPRDEPRTQPVQPTPSQRASEKSAQPAAPKPPAPAAQPPAPPPVAQPARPQQPEEARRAAPAQQPPRPQADEPRRAPGPPVAQPARPDAPPAQGEPRRAAPPQAEPRRAAPPAAPPPAAPASTKAPGDARPPAKGKGKDEDEEENRNRK